MVGMILSLTKLTVATGPAMVQIGTLYDLISLRIRSERSNDGVVAVVVMVAVGLKILRVRVAKFTMGSGWKGVVGIVPNCGARF